MCPSSGTSFTGPLVRTASRGSQPALETPYKVDTVVSSDVEPRSRKKHSKHTGRGMLELEAFSIAN